ncbi:hypothetical protein LCGC14_0862620 [marine sediment metagenome]|uniref:Uncharacterized protein n=1 Tax=marine sediment metagenome TaxID=412755 RepID=A0A0F9P6V5_9ZZZZ
MGEYTKRRSNRDIRPYKSWEYEEEKVQKTLDKYPEKEKKKKIKDFLKEDSLKG